MLDAVLFDLDGTLADTVPSLVACVNHALLQYGLRQRDESDILSLIGAGERDFFRGAIDGDVLRTRGEAFFEEIFRCYVDYCAAHTCDLIVPYAGITEAIDTLREEGYRLGVVSNKAHALVVQITETLFPGRVSAVIGVGEYPPKPDPAPAVAAAKMLGVRPSRCVFTGDSEFDMMTAVNAGMAPLGVSWGYRPVMILKRHGAAAICDDPRELPQVIDACRKGLIL